MAAEQAANAKEAARLAKEAAEAEKVHCEPCSGRAVLLLVRCCCSLLWCNVCSVTCFRMLRCVRGAIGVVWCNVPRVQLRVRKELDNTVAVPESAAAFPDLVLWGQKRGGIAIALDKMTAVARYPTLHRRFDMALSCMPLQPQDPARAFERNTWHVRVNFCPSRQVFIGLTTAPEHAIGTMNIARVGAGFLPRCVVFLVVWRCVPGAGAAHPAELLSAFAAGWAEVLTADRLRFFCCPYLSAAGACCRPFPLNCVVTCPLCGRVAGSRTGCGAGATSEGTAPSATTASGCPPSAATGRSPPAVCSASRCSTRPLVWPSCGSRWTACRCVRVPTTSLFRCTRGVHTRFPAWPCQGGACRVWFVGIPHSLAHGYARRAFRVGPCGLGRLCGA
jgi:hypothetical protein